MISHRETYQSDIITSRSNFAAGWISGRRWHVLQTGNDPAGAGEDPWSWFATIKTMERMEVFDSAVETADKRLRRCKWQNRWKQPCGYMMSPMSQSCWDGIRKTKRGQMGRNPITRVTAYDLWDDPPSTANCSMVNPVGTQSQMSRWWVDFWCLGIPPACLTHVNSWQDFLRLTLW